MKIYDQFYINGRWVEPNNKKLLGVINPSNETICAQISIGDDIDVDLAVSAAQKAFSSYGFGHKKDRVEILESIIHAFEQRSGDIADAISEEMGAPTRLAVGAQTAAGLSHFKAALSILKNFNFEEKSGSSIIKKEPIGVCGLITPWNWPLNQIACKVAPAIAVGCSMILKPSEIAPLSGYIFTQVMHDAKVPQGVYNMVNGDGPGVGTALSSHPLIDMVSFTGSTRAGILVAKNAASTVKRVAQELGGKSANIILPDADLEKAVRKGALSVFSNSGQSCNAPTRMLVPIDRVEEAELIAKKVANEVILGPSNSESTTMGPVVSLAQANKIRALIQSAIDEGAKLICGGVEKPPGLSKGYFIKPTIFSLVGSEMTIAKEEIFGPVFTIMSYDSIDHAIEIANDTPYGLAGYIQGKDQKSLNYVASRIRAGNINVNGKSGDIYTPFGGYKQSGNGRECGVHGFNDFMEIKAISGLSN